MLYVKGAGENGTYAELVEIKDTPDTGSDPEQIEVTTLKRNRKAYVAGRQDSPSQSFTYNYTEDNYFTKVSPICDNANHEFLIVYPDGTGTYIRGIAVTRKNAISLNSAIEATLVITPEDIQDKTSTQVTALLG